MATPPGQDAQFVSDQIGSDADSVYIQLGSDVPLLARTWTIRESILSQPGNFTLDINLWALAAAKIVTTPVQLKARYPAGTPFQLLVRGQPQLTGRTDRRSLSLRRGAGGTTFLVSGRDSLAELVNGEITARQSFKDTTFADMVRRALKAVGLDPSKLVTSNDANRSAKAGIPITVTQPGVKVDGVQTVPGTLGAAKAQFEAKFGDRWMEFLRKHLDRAGLFLWCAGDGTFVLSAPNIHQKAAYTIYRDLKNDYANILDSEEDDDVTERHSEVVVYGVGGGKKDGTIKSKGTFGDQEMADYGFDRPMAVRDKVVQTGAQAGYFARRKLAEERRDGYMLQYVIAGHTLPVSPGNANQRAVVTPDTVVHVHDEVMGIDGDFYVETVQRTGNPQAETVMRLMRPQDLVFGELEKATQGAVKPRPQPSPNGQGGYMWLYGVPPPPTPPPPGAVGQDGTGQYVDSRGNRIPQ